MILRRGKQPRAVDCLIHENVAVVIVRLAIRAATLAMKRTGQNAAPVEQYDESITNTSIYKKLVTCSIEKAFAVVSKWFCLLKRHGYN